MKKRVLFGCGIAILLAGGLVFFFTRDTANTVSVPLEEYAFSITPEGVRRALVGVTVTIPNGDDAPSKIVLDQYPIEGEVLLGGSFTSTQEDMTSTVNVVIPDFDIVDTERVSVLDVSGEDGTFFVAPMYVNFGGTGTFLMIGLYEFNHTTGKVVHHAVHFIDDRVPFNGFSKTLDNTVAIHYVTREEGAAMAATPTRAAVRNIVRDGTNINPVQ